MDFDLSGITKSGSISILKPSPSHSWQAPYGELNENILGVRISGKLKLHAGHAKSSLYGIVSLVSTLWINTVPPDILSAVSTESARRLPIPDFKIRRSTTNSIECRLFLSSFISSSNERTSPSTRTLTKPSFFARSNTFSCVPFLPLTIGLNTRIFVSISLSTFSTI